MRSKVGDSLLNVIVTIPDYVQEYLDENPDAVLDARLMTGLNTMATNLVERTFDEKNISPIRQPTVGHFWTCDFFCFLLQEIGRPS